MTEWQMIVVCALFGGAMFCAGASWAFSTSARHFRAVRAELEKKDG